MSEEFQDPLEDFEPKTYSDALEEALAEEPATAIEHEPFTTISPDAPLHEAVAKLAGAHIACLLVAEAGKLVGVISDRDLLDKAALEYAEVKDRPVRDFMTETPVYVYETDASASALNVMAVCGFRHVPILSLDEKIVGIVSPKRVTAFLHQHLTGG